VEAKHGRLQNCGSDWLQLGAGVGEAVFGPAKSLQAVVVKVETEGMKTKRNAGPREVA
jgi:hypothetical protein